MLNVNYRILVDGEKVRGIPAVRVVALDGDGAGEVVIAKSDDKTAVDFAVAADTTVALYHGYVIGSDKEFVQVADPTSLTATTKPVKAVATPTGKLYWVGEVTAAVAAKERKPSQAAGEALSQEPAEAESPEVVIEASVDLDAATPAEVVGVNIDDDIELALAPPSDDTYAATNADDVQYVPASAAVNPTGDKKQWLSADGFTQLTLKRKRDYLRDIGIDEPVDMRTHTSMVAGYREWLGEKHK